ncbi:MAG: ribbon-helix-helix protein, CopG family [Dehalococcoidia bacterium]|nr:ribbon-helix-helix protein, CopG family [Dehalococcoidia bacterium]
MSVFTHRLQVRLGAERRRRLSELATRAGLPISEVVRRMIDAAHERALAEQRQQLDHEVR